MAALCLVIVFAGCTLAPRAGSSPSPPAQRPVAGGPPTVSIAGPPAGVFGWVGYPLDVDVRGADPWGIGISRLDLRIGDTVVDWVVTPGNAAQTTFDAILEWIPSFEGTYTLVVQAYRPDGAASAPAMLTVGVIPAPVTPTPTAYWLPTPEPTPDPDATLDPDATPATGTPAPTPEGIVADLRVQVRSEELPEVWYVGRAEEVRVFLRNVGETHVPSATVQVRAAGASVTVNVNGIDPGQTRRLTVRITPQRDGSRTLRVEAALPRGYVDSDESNNTWTIGIFVSASPPPTPTPAPTPPPTATPAATPTPEPPDPTPTPMPTPTPVDD